MIDRNHALPLKRQAELVGISRSSLYYRPKPVSEGDLELMRRLDELHLEKPFMGARMLCDQLDRMGIKAGRRHVGTLMKSSLDRQTPEEAYIAMLPAVQAAA